MMGTAPTRACARSLLLSGLGLVGALAVAQAPAGLTGERQRLSDERTAVETRFKEQEAACQQRFAVTDCVNDAKTLRRDALAPLRRQSAALDDAQRKQRAAQQRENIGRKVEDAQAREREVVVRGAALSVPTASAPDASTAATTSAAVPAEAGSAPRGVRQAKSKEPPSPTKARLAPERPSDAERRANEADAQVRSAARRQAAQEHREAVERRNAERALRGKKVDPLPVP